MCGEQNGQVGFGDDLITGLVPTDHWLMQLIESLDGLESFRFGTGQFVFSHWPSIASTASDVQDVAAGAAV